MGLTEKLKQNILTMMDFVDLFESQNDFKQFFNSLKRNSIVKRRSERSLNGFTLDVLKSAIQKYIRVGEKTTDRKITTEFEKLVYCALELYFFKFLIDSEGIDKQDSTSTKRIYTNFKNRLKIILVEEINICNPLYEVEFDRLISKEDINCFDLIRILYTMCYSEKLRLPSDIKCVYFSSTEQKKNYSSEFGERFDQLFSDDKVEEKFMNQAKQSGLVKPNDPSTLLKHCALLLQSISKKSDEAFHWIAEIISHGQEKTYANRSISRYRFKDCFGFLFEFLKKYSPQQKNVDIALKYYKQFKNNKEVYIFIIWPFLYLIKDNSKFEYQTKSCPLSDDEIKKLIWRNIDDIQKEKKWLELDDYVLDMHTVQGRKNGKDREHFAKVSSLVKKENKIFKNQLYRDIYIFSKQNNQTKKKRKSEASEEDQSKKIKLNK